MTTIQATALGDIQPLTNNEYDKARAEAIKRIQRRAGEKPTRQQFERDYGPLWILPDKIAALVGISAWLVSSAHILNHAGRIAAESYRDTVETINIAGVQWAQAAYGVVHQVGFIVLAEAAMILFMVMWSSAKRQQRESENSLAYWFKTSLSIPLILALLTAIFVFVANWQSGIGLLESVLPPAVTIGLGIYFEGRIAEGFRRRQEVTQRYLESMDAYEAAQKDPETHPDYQVFHRQALAHLVRNKRANKGKDIPLALLKMAVMRETERERWAVEWDETALLVEYQETRGANFTPAASSPQSMTETQEMPVAATSDNGRTVTQG